MTKKSSLLEKLSQPLPTFKKEWVNFESREKTLHSAPYPCVGDRVSFYTQPHVNTHYILLGSETPCGKLLNGGRLGNGENWKNFLALFYASPLGNHSAFNKYQNLCILGEVNYQDIQHTLLLAAEKERLPLEPSHQWLNSRPMLEALGQASIDCQRRLASVVRHCSKDGLRPICISGGHEDILGLALGLDQTIGIANLDGHADFKSPEPFPHSGNGFSILYALEKISRYAVLGLNPLENNAPMLQALAGKDFLIQTMDSISTLGFSGKPTLAQSLESMVIHLQQCNIKGLSICLDVIERLPTVSCPGTIGLSQTQCSEALGFLTQKLKPHFLLIAEGMLTNQNSSQEARNLAKIQAQLVYRFIQAHQP